MKIRKRTVLIWIVAIITIGIFTTVIPTPVLADISRQQNILARDTINQTVNEKQSFSDKVKKFISFINPWQMSNLDQLGRTVEETETSNNESAVHSITSFWSALRTIAANAYNNFGRMIDSSTTENKQKEEEKETVLYNEQGRSINIIETNKNNSDSFKKTLPNISPTISKENSSEYYSGYDNFQRPVNTQPAPTDIPAPAIQQTVIREKIITPSPTTYPQRR